MCNSKRPAKLAMLILLALLLLYNGVGNVQCATVHENSVDLHELLNFKQGISDPNGALSNWNISTHFRRWSGVSWSLTRPWRVTGLNLTGQSLAGQISSSLGNLTFLNKLDLSNNNLVGPLPPLSNLQQLKIIDLNNNNLQGVIPDALLNCSSIVDLDLSRNFLLGAIPLNISFLSNLKLLVLASNNLTGIIPPTLGDITTLKFLGLNDNQLTGSIPDKIWQLPNILGLSLSQNNLSGGGIPRALSNLSSLESINLGLNNLGNALPSNIGDVFPNLQELILTTSLLQGHIPASLGNASGLQTIDLSTNDLTGQIPTTLGRLSSLIYLNLEGNYLEARDSKSWAFLHALGNCSFLQKLSLSTNELQGVVPNSVGNLPNISLQYLVLGGNKLSGIVPPSIGNLNGLTWLGLDFNNLTGPIGEWIGKLTNLVRLNLHENNFTGMIPSSIGILTKLTKLFLQNNEFSGNIPPTLGNLQQLGVLNLGSNNLQGKIPPEFINLKQLTELCLSSNKLTGKIPDSLDQCQNLVTIQLDQNILTGNIPISLGNLKGLGTLNLSRNSLSGTIPASLNDLKYTKLDLSYNHLEGEIPRNGAFENSSAVSLDGNPGLCGGAFDLHMPPCTVVSRRTRWQYYLIRVLIPLFGFMSLVLLVYFLLLEKKSTRAYSSEPYFGEHFLKVAYKDLEQATRSFSESNLIGRGSHGTVYRGKLKDTDKEVAVKVFDLEMRGAEKSFMSECKALRSIQHRNLLPIITACSTVDNRGNVFKALVYEFMANGNLDAWLHHKRDGKASERLGLSQRIGIVVNIADALDYLHHDCGRPTVHCDLKPSNILLDDDMNAVLGDFGIARFYLDSSSTSTAGSTSSIGAKGTIGYIAPEYGGGGHASISGDVYSFGIVLLEMMTGKRPTDPMFKDGLDIVNFVDRNFPHQIFNVIDAHIIEECKKFGEEKMAEEKTVFQCLVCLLQVALSCTCPLPSERMNMKQVASKLHATNTSYLEREAKK